MDHGLLRHMILLPRQRRAVLGIGSDEGKSVIVPGLSRWLHREEVRAALVQAQHMSLSS